jgi:hypothetical protein
MPSQLWRNINKFAVYVPGAARKMQTFETEVAENPTFREPADIAQQNSVYQ